MRLQRILSEIYGSAARTATPTAKDLKVPDGYQGIVLLLDVTAGATLSLTLKIRAKSPVGSAVKDIAVSTAFTGTGLQRLSVHPASEPLANQVISEPLPEDIQIEVTHGNANSATYSLHASFVP